MLNVLTTNIRLGWKCLAATTTQAFKNRSLIVKRKSFVLEVPDPMNLRGIISRASLNKMMFYSLYIKSTAPV